MRLLHSWGPPLTALILAMVAINSADVVHKWWHGAGPAVEWEGVEVLTKTVKPGNTLEVVYTAIVHRQCPAELRGYLVAPDGSVPVRYPPVAGGYTPASDSPIEIRVVVSVPMASDPGLAPLHSGPYLYRTIATRYCPGDVETDSAVPDAKFFLEATP